MAILEPSPSNDGGHDEKKGIPPFPQEQSQDQDDEGVPRRIVADRLARKLSARQVQMIAIGGTIGTGLFLGTGESLSTGGPGSMLLSYAIVGAIVFITMLSLGEMAAFMPVAGSFCTFSGYVLCASLFDLILCFTTEIPSIFCCCFFMNPGRLRPWKAT